MTYFLLVLIVGVAVSLLYRSNQLLDLLIELRKVTFAMSENIASLELVKTLARAVVSAQESEKDAQEAREIAQGALAELESKVTLDDEAKDLISRALGNAVHADPEQGEPIVDTNNNGVDDREEDIDDSEEDVVEPLPPTES